MRVELFYSDGCEKCAEGKAALKATADELIPSLEWRELNVLDDLDYAVEVGVLTLPSVAVDGELVFTSMPTVGQLREAFRKRTGANAGWMRMRFANRWNKPGSRPGA